MNDDRPPLATWLRQNAALMYLGLAHLPFLTIYFYGLWQLEHYQFFPFALIAFACMFVARGDRANIQLNWVGSAAIALDILLLLASSVSNWPKLAAVGFVIYCFAITSNTWEWQVRRRLTSLTLLPLVLISPPRGLDLYAISWLQENTTWMASRLLERFGHLHLRRGNIIELPNKELLVEEACSGVQSLFTVLFLATLIVCWQRRGILHAIPLILSGVIFAGVMNVFRISAIAIAWQDNNLDLTHGWYHDALGYAALVVAILLLISADSLLHFFLAPFSDHRYGPFAGVYRNPFTLLWNYLCGGQRRVLGDEPVVSGPEFGLLTPRRLGIVALVAASLQGVVLLARGSGEAVVVESDLSTFQEGVLPKEIEGFTFVDYSTEARDRSSSWGLFSNVWEFNGFGLNTFVSCDHPFYDWHFLDICYRGDGWRVVMEPPLKDDPNWHSATFELEDEHLGQHGRVIYSHFSGAGDPMQPVTPGISATYVIDRIRDNFSSGLWSLISAPDERTAYQVQVYAFSSQEISEEQLIALRKLHLATRTVLNQHLNGAAQLAHSDPNTN